MKILALIIASLWISGVYYNLSTFIDHVRNEDDEIADGYRTVISQSNILAVIVTVVVVVILVAFGLEGAKDWIVGFLKPKKDESSD